MAEIKNLTGAKVAKMVEAGTAQSVWDKILAIGGFGDVPFDHAGGIDISGLSEANQARVTELLSTEEKEAADAKADTKSKGGNK